MASLGPLVLKLQADAGPLSRDLKGAQDKIASASKAMANVPAPKFPFSGALQAAQDKLGQFKGAITKAFEKIPGGEAISGALTGIVGAAQSAISAFSSVASMLAANPWAAAAVGIAAVAAGLGVLIKSGFNSIMTMQNLAEAFVIGGNTASGLAFAFDTVGMGQDKAFSTLTKFEQKLGELRENPTGPLAQSLRNVGLEAETLASLPIDQALGVVSDAFNRTGSAADRARFASQFFGKSWTDIRELLSRGSAGLADAARNANMLGIALSDVDMARTNEAGNRAIRMVAFLGSVWKSFALTAANAAGPAVHVISDFISNAVLGMQPLLQIGRDIVGGITSILGGFAMAIAAAFGFISPVVGGLIAIIGSVWNVLKAIVGAIAAPFVAAFQAMSSAAGGLGNPLQLVGTILGGVATAFNFVAQVIGAVGAFIGQLVGGALSGLVAVLGVVWSVLQVVVEVGLIPMRIAWELLQIAISPFVALFELIGSMLGTLGGGFMGFLGVIRSVAVYLVDNLLGAVQGIIQGFGSLLGMVARIPGIGRAFTGVAAAAEQAAARIQALRNSVNGVTAPTEAGEAAPSGAAQQSGELLSNYDQLLSRFAAASNFFGLQGRELEIARLAADGLNQSQIEALRLHDAELDRLEEQAALRERIAKIEEQFRDPLESFNAGIGDLQAQLAGGLSERAAGGALLSQIEAAERSLGIGSEESRAPAALTQGSAAAASAINRAQTQNSSPGTQTPEQRLLAVQEALRQRSEEQTRLQQQMVELLRRQGTPEVIGGF